MISLSFFVEIGNLFLKFTQAYKGPRIAKTTLKRTKLEDSHISQFQNLLQSHSNQDKVFTGMGQAYK